MSQKASQNSQVRYFFLRNSAIFLFRSCGNYMEFPIPRKEQFSWGEKELSQIRVCTVLLQAFFCERSLTLKVLCKNQIILQIKSIINTFLDLLAFLIIIYSKKKGDFRPNLL